MITRRDMLVVLGTLSIGWARAQPVERTGKPVRVVILALGTRATTEPGNTKTFIDAMREMGWVEGRNVVYDRVNAEGNESRLPAIAAEAVARSPNLIWVVTTQSALVASSKTNTIPIVIAAGSNLVERGVVKSLARPGGNITGMQNISWELGGKRLQFLKQVLPKIARVGILVHPHPDVPGLRELKEIEKAAAKLGLTVFSATANDVAEFDAAIGLLVKSRAEAIFVTQSPLFHRERKRILELATRQRLPVAGFRSEHTDDGALMSYSALLSDQIRRSAQMADQILKGTKKPTDIPVEQPTKFDLVVNMKTAKALGITIPGEIMLQATKVIE